MGHPGSYRFFITMTAEEIERAKQEIMVGVAMQVATNREGELDYQLVKRFLNKARDHVVRKVKFHLPHDPNTPTGFPTYGDSIPLNDDGSLTIEFEVKD